ncbi:hypothetical protein YB2330_000214 [Saitoella coloradoensis]
MDRATRSDTDETLQLEQEKHDSISPATPSSAKKSWSWDNFKPDKVTLLLAIKSALGLGIIAALSQSEDVMRIETTLYYVSLIIASLFGTWKPRGAFFEGVIIAVFIMCAFVPYVLFSACMALLSRHQDSSVLVATRLGITNPAQLAQYDSATRLQAVYTPAPAALCATFLFIGAWLLNVLKVKLGLSALFGIIMGGIFSGILLTEAHVFPNFGYVTMIVRRLLTAILLGVAVQCAVNLFVPPIVNGRLPYLKTVSGILGLTSKVLRVQHEFFLTDPLQRNNKDTAARTMVQGLTGLLAKLAMLKGPAKREVVFGYMKASDLEELNKHVRQLAVPVIGLGNIRAIERDIYVRHVDGLNEHDIETAKQQSHWFYRNGQADTSPDIWQKVSEDDLREAGLLLKRSCGDVITGCEEAITHIQRTLRLGPFQRAPWYVAWMKKHDKTLDRTPEDDLFLPRFEAIIAEFWAHRTEGFEALKQKDRSFSPPLYMILYYESLIYTAARILVDMSKFADAKHHDGTMAHLRLRLPSLRSFRKAIVGAFDSKKEEEGRGQEYSDGSYVQWSILDSKDEMEPVHGWYRKPFILLWRFGQIMQGSTSAFGLRAAIAMLACTLPAYFHSSIKIFIQYRLIWITLTVLLGLQPIAGRAFSTGIMRLIGTVVGGVLGLLACEIGRKPAAIIPLYFLSLIPQFYVQIKNPVLYFLPTLMSMITEALIVGYELAEMKLGRAALSAGGQIYLSIPALFGYRVLLTVAGVVVSFVFTIFPSLITGRRLVRDELAQSCLFAGDLYSLVHTKVAAEAAGVQPRELNKRIRTARAKLAGLAASQQQLMSFTAYEPVLRGRWPRERYMNIQKHMLIMTGLLATMDLQIDAFTEDDEKLLAELLDKPSFRVFYETVLSTFHHVSISLALGRPLPPFMRSPVQVMRDRDQDVKWAGERSNFHQRKEYAAIAGIVLPGNAIARSLEVIVHEVKALYGENIPSGAGLGQNNGKGKLT